MRVLAEISDEGYPHYAVDTIRLTFCNDETEIKKVKYVSLEDFAELIGTGLDRRGTCMLGKMPIGYYNASVGIESKGFACEAILILPKKVHRITYINTSYDMMPGSKVPLQNLENLMFYNKCKRFSHS